MISVKRTLATLAAAAAGLTLLPMAPAGAQTAPTYTWTSKAAWQGYGYLCEHGATVTNLSSASLTVTVTPVYNGTPSAAPRSVVLPPTVSSRQSFSLGAGGYAYVGFKVTAPSGQLVVSADGKCSNGSTTYSSFTFGADDWGVTNPNGSTLENLQRANGLLDALAAKIDAIAAKVDAANGKLDAANGKLDALAAKVGNKTSSVCVDGTVRNDATNHNQMYLTLFNPANGAQANASVTYNTNFGPVFRTYGVGPLQRVQIDVSAELVGPTGQFRLRTDVDTVVTVSSTLPLHVNCSLYFSKVVPNVGPVSGALELPVSTN